MNHFLPLAAFAALAVARPWEDTGPPSPLAIDRELASLLPERCQLYLEGSGITPLLERGPKHAFLACLAATPLGQALLRDERDPAELLARAGAWLGEPALPLLAHLTRRGVGLGLDPASRGAALVGIATDAATARRGLAALFAGLEREFAQPGALRTPHARWSEGDVWFLGDGPLVALRGELVVLGNERELVAEVLELAADPRGRGLLDRPGFQELRAARGLDALLWSWLSMPELVAFGDEGLQGLAGAGRTPGAQALLGAAVSALCGSRALALTLTLEGAGLELRAQAAEAAGARSLAIGARDGAVPAEAGSHGLGTALLYRDYARFLSQRAELFPVEVQARFAELITNGALFFGGRDLGTEVLPHLSPWLRLVARELAFPVERRPEIALPGLAAIGVLDDPREGEAWTAALQTLIAVLGVERAQQGKDGLTLHLSLSEGIEITSARFPTPPASEGIDLRYNLEPAMAVVGRHLVLGTHTSLVHELARELAGAEPGAGAAAERLQLDPSGLATVVARNREPLILRKMLADGLERAAAVDEVEGLRLALDSLERITLEVGGAPTSPAAVLALTLHAPEER